MGILEPFDFFIIFDCSFELADEACWLDEK